MSSTTTTTHREVLASRCVAVLGVVTAAAHVPLAVAHATASLPLALVLLVMSLVCLPCAGHLWRAPSPRTWGVVVVAGSGMLIAHGVLVLLPAGTGGVLSLTGHAAHATALGTLPWLHSAAALALLAALTLVQVGTCAVLLVRRRTPRLLPWAVGPLQRARPDHDSRRGVTTATRLP